jgi:arginase family enzyme
MQINEYIIKNMKDVLSYDLVEFNPLRDTDRRTEQIALNLLAQVIRAAENKKKWEKKVNYF